ncbi:conserved Plasmodium protein, unknown function [Plasmodium gallinaceum]|uniref:Zinc finger protein n=1 Tax=Plasmodium gallinaceum TaxID=5849 RepID=A0A1J1GQ05_PLAGA|nr:conserved Plasmodium protein, unknown function [Plasmodium gallinaceum]CRG94599.1 conserved Plasmodium protein, unknown function [Plasmodium gallinaceum]
MSNSEEIDKENEDFKKAYNRIIIKNRILNEKDNNHINNIFEISKINDYNLIMYYEYILKLSFFSSNVNVLHMHRLVKSEYEKEFEEVAKCLKSNILISLRDTNEIDTNGNIIEYFLKNYDQIKNFEYTIGNADYPLGFEKNTNGIFQVFLFKVVPNKTLLLNKNNFHFMTKEEIPHNYDSIAIEKSLYYEINNSQDKKRININNYSNTTCINNNGYYSYIYKVKNSEQILPLYLIEFEFKCLRIDVSIPSCEYCYTARAIFYCYNDKAHLCDTCDMKYHEKNKILKNHKRIHISESPYQFGKCPYHPHELVENVCMKCFYSLCSNCLLIGNHSSNNYRNHPITNIKDAFILSNRKRSLSEINLENRKSRILNLLKKKHKLLSEIYSNYTSLQKRIDTLYKYIINELKTVKKKKVDFLMALKRSILSELLIIEWTEAFFFHTKLSLNLSDFILYQKKHELLTHFLTSKTKEINLVKYTPQWIFQKVFINSDLYIYEDNFYKLNLSNNKNIDLIIKDKKDKENNFKINENKLESIYNFTNIFNNKDKHLGIHEDIKLSSLLNDQEKGDENVKYSKLIIKNDKNNDSLTEKYICDIDEDDIIKDIHEDKIIDDDKLFNKYGIEKQNIDEIIKIKNNYSCIDEITNDKLANCNFLFRIFKNEKLLEKSILKNSYVYNELWKNLLNYKYINIIHILKAKYSYNTLELVSSFLNISNYHNSLEDFVKHIIKHEIYTLLQKNIDYHTKMKVTQLMDNVTTLLCIQNFKLSFIIDKHIQMCFSEIEKNEKQLLIDIENVKNDSTELYKTFLGQKEKCKLNIKKENNENLKVKANNFIEELENELNNEQKMNENKEKEIDNIESGNKILSKKCNIYEGEDILADDKWSRDKLQKKNNENIYEKEKDELVILKKIKEYMYVYIEKLINDLTNIAHKDLNGSIRFIFYLIHDEIDGINKNTINEKKFSIHTLTLCLDLFINSILYPYIFYVHEQNVNKSLIKSTLYKKVLIIFGQTLREISIFIFQIYNLGMYDNNIKVFINNIKNNKLLKNKITNENMFFLDVSQKLFNWIIKNLEAPRYYSPLKWNLNEDIEKSYQKIAREVINIDKSSAEFCINENVDYNILFSTKNFKDILTLCYSIVEYI